MYYKWLSVIFLLTILVLFTSQGKSDIFNGGFELADPNSGFGFCPPTGWEGLNFRNVVARLEPNMIEGRSINWDPNILEDGLDPIEGNKLVILSTGDLENETGHAEITQNILIKPKDILRGYFFFGTCDYYQWCDYGHILLKPDPNTVSDPNEILLARKGVEDVGNYSSMNGWEYFSYKFSEEQAGLYTIIAGVYDVGDLILNSYLILDGLNTCNSPSPADFNQDCRVDLSDFDLFAQDWLKDCSDPNNLCHEATDLGGNSYVDIRDLNFFADDWLIHYESEQ